MSRVRKVAGLVVRLPLVPYSEPGPPLRAACTPLHHMPDAWKIARSQCGTLGYLGEYHVNTKDSVLY